MAWACMFIVHKRCVSMYVNVFVVLGLEKIMSRVCPAVFVCNANDESMSPYDGVIFVEVARNLGRYLATVTSN